ncbi:MAG: DUF2934 domain-containing protein [Thiohalocapsa sp.]
MSEIAPDDVAFAPSRTERDRMVAVAAYFLAERRGFGPGGERQDWRQAEQQIDLMLARVSRQGVGRHQFERTGLRNALRIWAHDWATT